MGLKNLHLEGVGQVYMPKLGLPLTMSSNCVNKKANKILRFNKKYIFAP